MWHRRKHQISSPYIPARTGRGFTGRLLTAAASPFGQSITDACLSWSDIETLLAMLAEAAQVRLSKQA